MGGGDWRVEYSKLKLHRRCSYCKQQGLGYNHGINGWNKLEDSAIGEKMKNWKVQDIGGIMHVATEMIKNSNRSITDKRTMSQTIKSFEKSEGIT